MQQSNKKPITSEKAEIPNEILLPKVIELLEAGHTVTIPLKGFSMRPFLEDGRDKALLKKTGKIAVGAPVLAEISPKRYVLHRIVKIDGEKVTLLGDGNITPEHCLVSDIKASVVGFYRKGRKKLDRTDGRKWNLYSKVWMALRPVRRWLLAIYRRLWIPVFGKI